MGWGSLAGWLSRRRRTASHQSRYTPTAPKTAGNETLVGQYESMKAFTMPKLFRVVEVGLGLFLKGGAGAFCGAVAAASTRAWQRPGLGR